MIISTTVGDKDEKDISMWCYFGDIKSNISEITHKNE